ncbi:hypothetical protein EWH13_17205 [Bradyrhizobium elkanii]|nr:hypothetical protein EWH13_17205 [Bradyrhizobium elkanii]
MLGATGASSLAGAGRVDHSGDRKGAKLRSRERHLLRGGRKHRPYLLYLLVRATFSRVALRAIKMILARGQVDTILAPDSNVRSADQDFGSTTSQILRSIAS